ncbi:MAG: metallophosphoesterase [Candidatus Accumulibacter similis]|nr:MAG: metallophosphoesterase [Candidatus Accumulibacter similis]
MPTKMRVFVISDLHIGGEFSDDPAQRGFRIMSRPERLAGFIEELADRAHECPIELVINGDFIDFLAECHEGKQPWVPFVEDANEATATFRRVAYRDRDSAVFDALGNFLAKGHALVVLLGNHDVELALPGVRVAFEERLAQQTSSRIRFIYDGEAYRVGDALIEHGNRYDPFNVVDHDRLRRLRSLQSRGQCSANSELQFVAPAGSRLVAKVINPIKSLYSFIDLLKPESEPLIALLLALEPSTRLQIRELFKILPSAFFHGQRVSGFPRRAGDIASIMTADPVRRYADGRLDSEDLSLHEVMVRTVGHDAARELLDSGPRPGDIGSRSDAAFGLARLMVMDDRSSVEARLRLVRKTLGVLDWRERFASGVEADRYTSAARVLARNYRYVIFGHTHDAKRVSLGNGAEYLNSGTWSDKMYFPAELSSDHEEIALAALRYFLEDLRANRLQSYIRFEPTYVRLDISDDDRVVRADVVKHEQ